MRTKAMTKTWVISSSKADGKLSAPYLNWKKDYVMVAATLCKVLRRPILRSVSLGANTVTVPVTVGTARNTNRYVLTSFSMIFR